MKRADLIRKLDEAGCALIRHGGNHDWYRNPKTGTAQPVPRHRSVSRSKKSLIASITVGAWSELFIEVREDQ